MLFELIIPSIIVAWFVLMVCYPKDGPSFALKSALIRLIASWCGQEHVITRWCDKLGKCPICLAPYAGTVIGVIVGICSGEWIGLASGPLVCVFFWVMLPAPMRWTTTRDGANPTGCGGRCGEKRTRVAGDGSAATVADGEREQLAPETASKAV